MKQRIFVMMCGLPGSGKTTAAKELQKYVFDKYGITPWCINKDAIYQPYLRGVGRDMPIERLMEINNFVIGRAYAMLKDWTKQTENPVCIWDNASDTSDAFDRKSILDYLNDETDLFTVIHMNKNLTYCKNRTKLPGSTFVRDRFINACADGFQQPIYKEGFHYIFRVGEHDQFDPEVFMNDISKFNTVLDPFDFDEKG